jgi:hypothetical protein
MKNKLWIVIGVAAVACSAWLGYVAGKTQTHQIANSYFRIGQQAALIARDRQDGIERALRRKYPDGVFTNAEDFEAIGNPLNMMDDPRIWTVIRELNYGSTLGLDTNDWSGLYSATVHRDPHIWTVLK